MCCHFIQACCYSCSNSKGWFYSLLHSLLVARAMFTILLAVIKQSWRENRLETWHMVRKPTVVSVSLRSGGLLAGCLEVAGLPQAACQLPCYCQQTITLDPFTAVSRLDSVSSSVAWTDKGCVLIPGLKPLWFCLFHSHTIVLFSFSCYNSPPSLFSWTDTRLD